MIDDQLAVEVIFKHKHQTFSPSSFSNVSLIFCLSYVIIKNISGFWSLWLPLIGHIAFLSYYCLLSYVINNSRIIRSFTGCKKWRPSENLLITKHWDELFLMQFLTLLRPQSVPLNQHGCKNVLTETSEAVAHDHKSICFAGNHKREVKKIFSPISSLPLTHVKSDLDRATMFPDQHPTNKQIHDKRTVITVCQQEIRIHKGVSSVTAGCCCCCLH